MEPATRPAAPSPTTDPLLETEVFWSKYRTPIIAGILAVVLGAIGIGAYKLMATQREAAAASALAQAKDEAAYQKVIADYGSTPAGASAHLFLANQQRTKGAFAEANTTLQKFLSEHPKHELVTTAKMAMAANQESLGKPDEALEAYRRIAADYPKSFNAPLALLAQVPLLKAKGEVDQARQVCETVLTQFRQSAAADEATRYLRTLKPAAPAAAAIPPTPAAAAVASPAPSAAATP
jgi:TolA-binding protein